MSLPMSTSSNVQNLSTKASYAQVMQQVQVPTKEQGIILDAIEGVSIQEYARAIGKIIAPINIKFISRISHGRVCMYLSSKQIADSLTDNQTKINIGNQELEIRPLISKAQRIILSNVCPIIPNELIVKELSTFNITPCSKITYIRAGINDIGFSHLLSFRRQLYIKPEDIAKLPPMIPIKIDNTTYHIYLSTEKVTCFLCNEEGHLAKYCKNIEQPSQHMEEDHTEEDKQHQFNIPQVQSTSEKQHSAQPETVNESSPNTLKLQITKNKRSLTRDTLSTSSASNASPITKSRKIVKYQESKKNTEVTLKEIETQLEPAKDLISVNAKEFPLNFTQVANFLFETYGKTNIHEIAANYTNKSIALIEMLTKIHNFIMDKKLKHRITRLKKKLDLKDIDDTSSIDSSYTDEADV